MFGLGSTPGPLCAPLKGLDQPVVQTTNDELTHWFFRVAIN